VPTTEGAAPVIRSRPSGVQVNVLASGSLVRSPCPRRACRPRPEPLTSRACRRSQLPW
jgi:hypothetical protein